MSYKVVVAGGAVLLAAGVSRAERSEHPNIVLIISDDHRADWMGHKGTPFMETPNLDRLAAEGISFENAFACSGVCSPSRASILTGRYAHRASAPEIVWQNNSFLQTQKTFAENLKAAGYRTAYIGKLHLGEDELPKPGFDEWIGFPFVGNFQNQPLWINGKRVDQTGFTDDRLAELAAERIRAWSGDPARPFCVVVGLKAPHIPFDYPERMKGRLRDTVFEKPETWELRKPGLAGCCLDAAKFPPAIPAYGGFQEWVRSYSRLALTLDESVGTIVRALETSGQLENTLLIYTSDQGYSLGEFGLSEKHVALEQVMRVPMIVRFPAWIPAGSKRSEMVLNLDIAPTVLDVAGAEPLSGMDGKSWRALFATNPARRKVGSDWRSDFFFSYWSEWDIAMPPMHALRTERYKLIEYEAKPLHELYDLELDPLEKNNLYGTDEAASVQREMEGRLRAMKHRIGFAPREQSLLPHAYALAAASPDEEVRLLNGLDAGSVPERAVWMQQPFDLQSLGIKAGDPVYFIIPVERLTDFDPYVTFEWFKQGGFKRWEKQGIPASALQGGRRIWMNRAYAKAEGLDYAPMGIFNEKGNVPLSRPVQFVVFKCLAPPGMGAIQCEVHAPEGSIRIEKRN